MKNRLKTDKGGDKTRKEPKKTEEKQEKGRETFEKISPAIYLSEFSNLNASEVLELVISIEEVVRDLPE